MDGATKSFLKVGISQSNAEAKALANYLFREMIEYAHIKYNISDDDIRQMCKIVANRANQYIKLCEDPKLRTTFLIEAAPCSQWDEPEITEDIKRAQEIFEEIAKELE